ncbi:hypothetical protein Tco_0005244 [Tanacetum coccineum]
MTPGTLSSGLVLNSPHLTPYVPPTKKDWDTLFQPMYNEYFNPPPSVASPVPAVVASVAADSTGSPSSTLVDQDAPYLITSKPLLTSPSSSPPVLYKSLHDTEVTHLKNLKRVIPHPFFGVSILEPNSKESSSRDVIPTNVHSVNQPPEHLKKWTNDHSLDNVIGNPSRPVSTRH